MTWVYNSQPTPRLTSHYYYYKKKSIVMMYVLKTLYRSLAVLLSGFCMIVMNLSSSETAPESTWWRFKRWRKGALASSRAGHSTQKCCSSSTCPVLHDLHILSSTGRPMYLPVWICNGAVPPLNRASRDLWGFILTFCTYSSVSPYSVLKLMYVCQLWFG